MIVHPKFAFVHLPKTGGTSIINYLLQNIPDTQRPNLKSHSPAKMIKGQYPFIFGSIRNPWDWYVSMYEFNFIEETPYSYLVRNRTFKEFLEHIFSITETVERTNFEQMNEMNIGLLTNFFLITFCGSYDLNFHWIVNEVIRIENLYTELPLMFKKFIFPLTEQQIANLKSFPRLKTSKRERDYRRYYNEKTKNLIKEKDKYIIQTFHYEF